MILIVTSSFDETVQYLLDYYLEFRKDSFRFDIDKFPEYVISISGSSWSIEFNGCRIQREQVSSIYYRKPTLPDVSDFEPKYHVMIQKDIIAVVNGIVDSFDGTVISKPCILRKTENKIFQLIYATHAGWRMPDSYIGNSNKESRLRWGRCSIIKPLSTGVIRNISEAEIYHTSIFEGCDEDISMTPVYLQEYVAKGYEVRLTVVGEQFYAVRIDTIDKVDWRKDYENHKYSLVECPENIRIKCRKMMKDFDLSFGAFDFIITPENDWIFLELNPNGQWLWLEKSMGLDISSHLVGKLMGYE